MQSSTTKNPADTPKINYSTEDVEWCKDNQNTLENHVPSQVAINTASEHGISENVAKRISENEVNEIGQLEDNGIIETVVMTENPNISTGHIVETELIKTLEINAISLKNQLTTTNDENTNITTNASIENNIKIENIVSISQKYSYVSNLNNKMEKLFGTENDVNEGDYFIKEEFKIDTISEPIIRIQSNTELDLSNEHIHNDSIEYKIPPNGSKKDVEPQQPNKELGGSDVNNTCPEIKIKREIEEIIVNKLEDLGDNFTVSILDILDPFVCIEVSDSSEDED